MGLSSSQLFDMLSQARSPGGTANTLPIDCSASIRKPGFEAELNQGSSVKSPEPPSIKRPEDLKNTLLVSMILQSHAIQRGRITVILHSPVVLTPRRWQQSSLQQKGTCITAKSFLTRGPLPLCRQTACSCIVMGCPPSLTEQLSGAAPALLYCQNGVELKLLP